MRFYLSSKEIEGSNTSVLKRKFVKDSFDFIHGVYVGWRLCNFPFFFI